MLDKMTRLLDDNLILPFTMNTLQLVDYLNNGSVVVHVMGKQYIRKSAVGRRKDLTTKDMLRSDRGVFSKYEKLQLSFQITIIMIIISQMGHSCLSDILMLFFAVCQDGEFDEWISNEWQGS